jgi:hypothetical protein
MSQTSPRDFSETIEIVGVLLGRLKRNRFKPGSLQEAVALMWWRRVNHSADLAGGSLTPSKEVETTIPQVAESVFAISPGEPCRKIAGLERYVRSLGVCEDTVELVGDTIRGITLVKWLQETCSTLNALTNPYRHN